MWINVEMFDRNLRKLKVMIVDCFMDFILSILVIYFF